MQTPVPGGGRAAVAVLAALALSLGLAAPASAAGPPAVSAVSPAGGAPGVVVTLSGSNLGEASGVSFNGAAAAFTVAGDTSVSATVPAGATDGQVLVSTPDGVAGLHFDVDEPPGAVLALGARPGDGALRLSWTAPAPDVHEVVVRRAEGTRAPGAPGEGTAVATAPGVTSAVDSGLVNGATYSYAVWARDAAGSLGPAAVVTGAPAPPPAQSIRIGTSAARVTAGTTVVVSGVLLRADGSPVAGEQVTLLHRPQGAATLGGVAAAVTDAAGGVRIPYQVRQHAEVVLRHGGHAFSAPAMSVAVGITARHGLVSRLVPAVVDLGATSLVEGRVGPAVSGVVVRLERRTATGWSHVTTAVTDTRGGFRIPVRPTTGGEQVLRVVTVADAGHHSATGVAMRLVALTRTLREGMRGADVLALEHRLADLRYDVGPVSGTFDYDTRLAVMAFQKVHGLARTGVADPATRARLARPVTPALRRPMPGLSVEVDLARQILLYARNGVVQRILPVSSGNNELYTVDGVTSRAVTPVGSFRVTRKIDGIRVSRLGQLYQPAYFVGGYAIHGSPSVPGHPASHGCIRVTRPAMARLFPLLPVGTPVLIHRG